MKIPNYIEFHNNTNSILSRFLKAAEPKEGCAILIGQKKSSATDYKNNFWEIKYVWNCRNIWGQEESKLIHLKARTILNQKNIQLSKNNYFEIDPKDQIAAQKWARRNELEVLCCAHSHPLGKNRPSEMDLFWHRSPGLMVISNKDGNLKAWWIKNKFSFHKVKIEIFSLT
ncbi:M67 family metallopeptidase [Prochlorococcus marinus]|uniref:Peptidase n=1 Tax=Prochlorococcus marinus XMU1408 TaxID=2213228 RepID=A0A318RBW8_PROMR|nr:M67 family metallopeptidase [Prochlorococcus marinus]MBW3042789.1 peptidase [Prochlorococcus marinus str. XMU1408]PYE00616.1 peptidase [Prochlorococcus marinus XMU1408]